MQFQVPQFIETEDRIVGPLTLKQFLFLAAAAAIAFISFFYLEFFLWIVLTALMVSIASAFAFIRINGQSFVRIFFSAFGFYWKPRLYLWERPTTTLPTEKIKLPTPQMAPPPKKEEGIVVGLRSRLDNLWDQLRTTRASIPKREKAIQPSVLEQLRGSKERFEMLRRITGEKEMARRVDYR